MKQAEAIHLLCASAYLAYSACFGNRPRYEFFSNIEPGMLVMETSSIGCRRDYDLIRIGYLDRIVQEPWHTDEDWEAIKDDYEKRPMQQVFYIRALYDGKVKRWTNASFVRVANSVMEVWQSESAAAATKEGAGD
jgi:hypothetical protein